MVRMKLEGDCIERQVMCAQFIVPVPDGGVSVKHGLLRRMRPNDIAQKKCYLFVCESTTTKLLGRDTGGYVNAHVIL